MNNFSHKASLNKQRVAASEARFRALVTATSDVIYSLSADWKIMHELDGRGFLKDAQEPTTDWMLDNIYPEDLKMVKEAISVAITEKKIFQLEHRVLRADRTPGWTFSRAVPIFNDQGEIIEWFGTASDITGRKQAEEALKETRARSDQQKRLYETVLSSIPDLMYVFDLNYRFSYVNDALITMLGRNWNEIIGKRLHENGYAPWHAEMHEREFDQIKTTKQPIRGEVSFSHASLGPRVYDYILMPVFDEQGEVEAIAGATRDITERKQWEDSLAQSSVKLQTLNEELAATNEELEASNEELIHTNKAFALVNQNLTKAHQKIEEDQVAYHLAISAANFGTWHLHSVTLEFIADNRLKELYGFHPEEPFSIEQALMQIDGEYRDFVKAKVENAMFHGGDYDITYPVIGMHDKRLRWLRAIGNLKMDPSGTFSAFTGVIMDITEQHLSAAEIKRAEENLRMAIDAAGLGTFYINVQDRSLKASPKVKEFFGFPLEAEVSYYEAINQIHPDYQLEAAAVFESAITNHSRLDIEYPIIGYQDGKIRWIRGIGEIQQADDGDYLAGVLHEITEQKLNEIRKNDFIGMVSHELRTPLTSMKGYIQLLQIRLKNQQDNFIDVALKKANAQVTKMTSMINGFLNISMLESGKITLDQETFDLATLVKEIEDEVVATLGSHKFVFEPIQSNLVNADRNKIGQVIHNLIANGVKYSPLGTTIHVACSLHNNTAKVSVKDQGIGIKQEDLTKVFQRYYRVEGLHMNSTSGFGIGLYLCAEIIGWHKGAIWAESTLGEGSTFTFTLPGVGG